MCLDPYSWYPSSTFRLRVLVQFARTQVPQFSRTLFLRRKRMTRTTTSWRLLEASRLSPPRSTQRKLQPLLPSQLAGSQNSFPENDSSHSVWTRQTQWPQIPPRLFQAHRNPSPPKTRRRRNANSEGLGRLAAVNTTSTQRMTFWVSSCWRSRAPMISPNSATVRAFTATMVPLIDYDVQ